MNSLGTDPYDPAPTVGGSCRRARVKAAVDFGTYGTGFAWSIVEEDVTEPAQRHIAINTQWESAPTLTAKNLSALLIGPDGSVEANGFEARRRWQTLGRQAGGRGMRFYTGFKMDLPDQQATEHEDEAEDLEAVPAEQPSGETQESDPVRTAPRAIGLDLEPYDLAVACLRRVYQQAVSEIADAGYHEDEIDWCLPTPALWSDYQKQQTRCIARDAGLPAEDGRLILALEPEAAAHYALLSGVNTPGGLESTTLRTPGTRFMVVDCGGGTVDITSYEVDPDGRMVQIGAVTSGKHGSNYINGAFLEQLMVARLGRSDILEQLRTEVPDALLELADAWERAKLTFRLEQEDPVWLSIPTALDRALPQGARRRLSRVQEGTNDSIVITAAETRQLFDTVVPDILELIDQQFAAMAESRTTTSPRDVLVLAGGFAESPYLQAVIRNHVADQADVLIPANPGIAVLVGAVHFCHEPQTRARRTRLTYGCAISRFFEDGVDDDAHRYVSSEGRVMCDNRFDVYVRKNEVVDSGSHVVHGYLPVEPGQESVDIELYSSPDFDPRYVTDEGCRRIGAITCSLAKVMKYAQEERAFKLYLFFGETEIKARAVVVRTGKEIETTVTFHTNY
ncbi:hypothetical protein [Catenulispora rubra]|uniref:hypothetical protein n=1 Tax=Catenulispora rubra TaxID=280293 RepID=UPI001891FB0F|nr:hypothetical protein [Catenulispora rubra]